MKTLPRSRILLVAISLLVACTTPTPIASLPSPEPTETTLPPTAASTAVPTNTAAPTPTDTSTVAPTTTVTPTSSPSPTVLKSTPTATPALAHAAAIPAGAPLNVAVRRTLDNTMVILGELNQALSGVGGSCDIAVPRFDAVADAPTYDVGEQSSNGQSAYALYRQAVDIINNDAAPKIRRVCTMGGGPIDKLDIQVPHNAISNAIGLLGRALDLLPPAPASGPEPSPTPKPTVATSSMALSDLLRTTMERMQIVGGLLDGAQLNLDTGFCQQFGPQYATLIIEVKLNEADRPATWADSYGAYKAAIHFFQNKLYRAREVCDAGGGTIGKAEFSDMRGAVNASINALAHAYDQLRFKNLLGQ